MSGLIQAKFAGHATPARTPSREACEIRSRMVAVKNSNPTAIASTMLCGCFRGFQIPEARPIPKTEPESVRSEEHTSELQSRPHLVCRLLLEEKNNAEHVHSIIELMVS